MGKVTQGRKFVVVTLGLLLLVNGLFTPILLQQLDEENISSNYEISEAKPLDFIWSFKVFENNIYHIDSIINGSLDVLSRILRKSNLAMDTIWENKLEFIDKSTDQFLFSSLGIVAVNNDYLILLYYYGRTNSYTITNSSQSENSVSFNATFFVIDENTGSLISSIIFEYSPAINQSAIPDQNLEKQFSWTFFGGLIIEDHFYIPVYLDDDGINQLQLLDIEISEAAIITIDIPAYANLELPFEVTQVNLRQSENVLIVNVKMIDVPFLRREVGNYTEIYPSFSIDRLTGVVELSEDYVSQNCDQSCPIVWTEEGYRLLFTQEDEIDGGYDFEFRDYDNMGNNISRNFINLNSSFRYRGPLYVEKEYFLMGLELSGYDILLPYLYWQTTDNSSQEYIPFPLSSNINDGLVMAIYQIERQTYGILAYSWERFQSNTFVFGLYVLTIPRSLVNTPFDYILAIGIPSFLLLSPIGIVFSRYIRYRKVIDPSSETYPKNEQVK